MNRKIVLIAAFVFGLSFAGANAEDGKRPKGKLDKGQLFEKLDANGDGKLSKDEFKTGFDKLKEQLTAKGGDKAKKLAEKMDADKAFEKLDADKDGTVGKSEFEKFEPLGGIRKKADK